MSVRVTTWVWMQIVGDAEAKLVLLKLADQANDDGECWPSRRTIAEACETSVSTVTRSIRYLVGHGYIQARIRQREDGGRTSNLYIFPRFTTTPSPSDPPPSWSDLTPGSPTDPPPGSATDPGPGSAVTRHEPSVEPSLNPQEEETLRKQNAEALDRLRKDLGL